MKMPMDMNEKNTKKKALDLMIVIGGKPGKDKKGEESEDMESKDHSGCKCPCCGAPCAECSDDERESEDEDYE
jgi:hypothetical protein